MVTVIHNDEKDDCNVNRLFWKLEGITNDAVLIVYNEWDDQNKVHKCTVNQARNEYLPGRSFEKSKPIIELNRW